MTVTTASLKAAKEIVAYLNACIDKTGDDPAGIIKALELSFHADVAHV
jgi:DNA-binding phage protein